MKDWDLVEYRNYTFSVHWKYSVILILSKLDKLNDYKLKRKIIMELKKLI